MNTKRLYKLLAMALTFAMVLSACGGNNGNSSTAQGGDAGKQVKKDAAQIKVAIVATGNVPVDFQKQMDRFNEQHKGEITAEILTFSSGDAYNQALMGQIAGGVAPDVFVVDGGIQMKKFGSSNAILPLNDLVKKAGLDMSNFEANLVTSTTIEGKLYGVPKDYNTTALFYNKDMFKAANLEAPKSWNEIKKDAKTLTSKDQFGFGINPQLNYYYPFIKSAGADFVTASGIDKTKFLSPEHEEALKYLVSLFNEDKSAASPQMVAAGWDGEMFAKKKVAMLYGGTWIPGVIMQQDPKLPVAAVPLPVNKSNASMLYTTGWVISSKSKNPDAAMQLIKFLSSDDELVEGNKAGLIGIPPTVSGMDKLMATKKDDPFLPVYKEVVKNGVPFGWIDPAFVDNYNKMLERIIYKPKEQTVRQALAEMGKTLP